MATDHPEKTAKRDRATKRSADARSLGGARLSRERIIDAAIAIIERDGVGALSMRGVAAEMGSGAMSLYRHVANKQALLDGVVERIAGRLETEFPTTGAWQDQLRTMLSAIRRVATAYPRTSLLVYSNYMGTPPIAGLVRNMIVVLLGAGFSPERSVALLRAFMSFTLGEVVRQVNIPQVTASVTRDLQRFPLPDVPLDNATVRAVIRALKHHDLAADFEFGHELLVQAVEVLRNREDT